MPVRPIPISSDDSTEKRIHRNSTYARHRVHLRRSGEKGRRARSPNLHLTCTMAPYYSTYYDPANSSAHVPQSGYTYQNQTSNTASQYSEPATTSGYQPSTYAGAYSNNTSYPWYESGGQNNSASDSRGAAETLSSLSAQEHGESTSGARTSSNTQYGTGGWRASGYASSATQPASNQRTASITSPLYQTHTNRQSATSGGYNSGQPYAQPEDTPTYSYSSYSNQYQTSSGDQSRTANSAVPQTTSTRDYSSGAPSAPNVTQQLRPDSPYNVQQQYSRSKTSQSHSRGAGSSCSYAAQGNSPVVGNSRVATVAHSAVPHQVNQASNAQYSTQSRQSASVEPVAPITVNPSQVYDPYAEQQRKAAIAAEQRRKAEAVAKARKEEEEREAEEKRKAEEAKAAKVAKAKAAAARKAEEAATRKRQAEEDAQGVSAAKQLSAAASAGNTSGSGSMANLMSAVAAEAAGDDVESEMRAMFRKMRELNSKDPGMLARLWEEERQSHVAQSQSPPARSKPTAPVPSRQKPPKTVPAPAPAPAPATVPAPVPQAQALSQSASKSNVHTSSNAGVAKHSVAQSAGAVPAASPQPQNPASAIWPPGNKVHLAEAAAKWLNNKPENAGKAITPARIITILESNPSYIVLCETLERLGSAVDRAAFARTLLSAVPDGMKTSGTPKINPAQPIIAGAASSEKPPGVTPNGTLKSRGGRPRKDGTPASSRPPKPSKVVDLTSETSSRATSTHPLSGMPQTDLASIEYGTVPYQSNLDFSAPPDFGNYEPAADSRPSSNPSMYAVPPHHQSPYFPQVPLAQGQSASPSLPHPHQQSEPPHKPLSKAEAARKRTFADLVDLTAEDEMEQELPPRPHKMINLGHPSAFPLLSGNGPTGDLSRPEILKYMFTGTQANFARDPSGTKPGQPHLPPKLLTKEEDLKGKILVEPVRREKVARKSTYDPRTIARDVLLATGRHPEMPPLNAHLMVMQDFLRKHANEDRPWMAEKMDLSTIRWDLIDPGEPLPPPEPKKEVDEAGDGDEADDEDEPAPEARETGSRDGSITITGSTTSSAVPSAFPGIKKRRGRPPRHTDPGLSSHPAASRDTPKQTTSAQHDATNPTRSANMPPGRPPRSSYTPATPQLAGAGSPSSAPVGYAALRANQPQLDENGNPIKKKGRPVGWRKAIHSKAAQAGGSDASPAAQRASRQDGEASSQTPVKRRGRPAGVKTKPPPKSPEANFQVFKCEWIGCKAQLHSLELLRKHIFVIHNKAPRQCLWNNCSRAGEATGKGKDRTDEPLEFDEAEAWVTHIDNRHLFPLAWELGDGTRGTTSGAPSARL